MNPDVELLERNVARLTPYADAGAARFNEVLFVDHPEVKPSFQGVSISRPHGLGSVRRTTVLNLEERPASSLFIATAV